jgi:hypothetical protein
MRIVIIIMFIGCLLSTNLWADHQPDNRYNVRGYVLDANKDGINNVTTRVLSEGKTIRSIKTNADGYYSLHFQLHDDDSDRVLNLRAGRNVAELRVNFNSGDTRSVRIHEANFIDGKFVEGAIGGFRFPTWIYAVGGLILIFVIVVFLEKSRKKKIRLAKYGTSGKHTTSKHKTKKARRKSH